MAINSLVNYQAVNGADAMYQLKNVLSSSGWIVVSSSNGVAATIGDAWTSYLAVTSSYSWVQLRSSDGTRYFTFQKGTDGSHEYWRNKYLTGSYNENGTATTVPTAVTGTNKIAEWVMTGGGDDQDAPTFSQFLYAYYTPKYHIVANSSPNWWWFGGFDNLTATPRTALGFDPVAGANPGDSDPAVIWHRGYHEGNVWTAGAMHHTSYTPAVAFYSGSAGQHIVRIPGNFLRDAHGDTKCNMTVNSITGKQDVMPIIYARNNSVGIPVGYKGISQMCYWVTNVNSSQGTTYNITGPKSHIDVCQTSGGTERYLVPWDGVSTFKF